MPKRQIRGRWVCAWNRSLSEFLEDGGMQESEEKELNPENESKQEEISKDILEEIEVEDLTVDGICGVY